MTKNIIIVVLIGLFFICSYSLDKVYTESKNKDSEIKQLQDKLYLDSILINIH